MKKFKKSAIYLLLIMLISSLFLNITAVESGTQITGIEEIPVLDPNTTENYMPSYTDKDKLPNVKMLTSDEAKAENVPEGYTGHVLKMTDDNNENWVGIPLDMGNHYIQEVESITVRLYCPQSTETTDGLRLADYKKSWIIRMPVKAKEEWTEITISNEGPYSSYSQIDSFEGLNDGTGHFKPMQLCVRNKEVGETVYIDSITINLKEKDTTPPKIEWSGEENITMTAGKKFDFNATAYDEYYKVSVEPEFIWSEGAIDNDGYLLEGNHTCKVKFTDPAGNTSELNFTFKIGPKDTEAPVLNWAPDSIIASAGMRPMLTLNATDAIEGELEMDIKWSEGALSERGLLNEGDHTLTLSACDSTGNKVEKVIKVTVLSGIPELE